MTISGLFEKSMLSEAAYVDWWDVDRNQPISALDDVKAALIAKGFSDAQATEFVAHWKVVYHQPNTSNGFSSTLFESIGQPGTYVYALRGTEGFWSDLLGADLGDIVLDGLALDQIVAMYNDWQRINTPNGQVYQAARLETLTAETIAFQLARVGQVVPGSSITALEYLQWIGSRTDIVIDQPLGLVRKIVFESSDTVFSDERKWGAGLSASGYGSFSITGHSLGGHLATAFTRVFRDVGGSALTVNGAGFATGPVAGLGGYASLNISNLFGMLGGLSFFDPTRIQNIYGEKGPEIVTQNGPGLFQQGGHQAIFIESLSLRDTIGHGAGQMTDSLSLYDLFANIDPLFDTTDSAAGIAKITGILNAASNRTALSLEATLDSLRMLFKDPAVQSVVSTATDDRQQFYRNLYDPAFQNRISAYTDLLSIDSLVDKDAATIEANAFGDISYRYALKVLNPFAVLGEHGIYDQFNQGGELDVYDVVARSGTLTSEYIADRASMLEWWLKNNAADGNIVLRDSGIETTTFENKKTAAETDVNLIVVGTQRSSVITPRKVIFGSPEDETFNGSDVYAGDHIYAGDGDDTLIGGGGNDYLEGGRGWDTYMFYSDDGVSRIVDTDGLGRVIFDGMEAGGADEIANGMYVGSAGQFRYSFVGDLTIAGTLIINGKVLVENFRNGDLGITLNTGGYIPTAHPTENVVESRFQIVYGTDVDDFYVSGLLNDPDPIYPSAFPTYDYLFLGLGGNDVVTSVAVPSEWDSGQWLYGGIGNDILLGRESWNPHLYGEGGQDMIYGGASNDFLFGDADLGQLNFWFDSYPSIESLEFVIGYAGPLTGAEPQFSYGYNVGALWDGYTGDQHGGDVYFPGGIRDVLEWLGVTEGGQAGDRNSDFISGGTGNDEIFGGSGSDLVFGDDGDDVLYGGNGKAGGVKTTYNASLSYMPYAYRQQIYPLLTDPGDDYLDGGDGDDKIIDSDGGNDYLVGGSGNDLLRDENPDSPGVASFNYLNGGDGNDQLFCDNQSLNGVDTLIGGNGNDIFTVKGGNAYIEDVAGDDTYHITLPNVGKITILEGSGSSNGMDKLVLEGTSLMPVSAENILVTRDDSNLYIGFGNVLDRVTVLNWFRGDEYRIEQVTFQYPIGSKLVTGEIPIAENLTPAGGILTGGEGDDILIGKFGEDLIRGEGGDDVLVGDAGSDTVIGGKGNDLLDGGAGDDTYVFNSGDGIDTIRDSGGYDIVAFGTGITPEMLTLDPDTLQIRVGDSGDAIGTENPDALVSGTIESFRFSDGAELTYSDLLSKGIDFLGTVDNDVLIGTSFADRMEGLEGNDYLQSGAGDDVLEGGPGADSMVGGTGSDAYRFDRDFGKDLIEDSGGNLDTLEFGVGIYPSDLNITRGDGTLTIAVTGTEDVVTVRWEPSLGYQIEQIKFADGTVWDALSPELLGGISDDTSASVVKSDATEIDIEVPVIQSDAQTTGAPSPELDSGNQSEFEVDRIAYTNQAIAGDRLVNGVQEQGEQHGKVIYSGYVSTKARADADNAVAFPAFVDDIGVRSRAWLESEGGADRGSLVGSRSIDEPHGTDGDDAIRRTTDVTISDGLFFSATRPVWDADTVRLEASRSPMTNSFQCMRSYALPADLWQDMHDQLTVHLADGRGNGSDEATALVPVMHGYAQEQSFTRAGHGGGSVGLEDCGAANLQRFTGLQEGLSNII